MNFDRSEVPCCVPALSSTTTQTFKKKQINHTLLVLNVLQVSYFCYISMNHIVRAQSESAPRHFVLTQKLYSICTTVCIAIVNHPPPLLLIVSLMLRVELLIAGRLVHQQRGVLALIRRTFAVRGLCQLLNGIDVGV